MNKILFFGFILLFAACGTNYEPLPFDASSQEATDNEIIIAYLKENGMSAEHTKSGIYYIIDEKGSNEHPSPTSKIKAHYNGTLLDGTKFDSSHDRGQPLQFQLNGVIQGWKETIPMLGKGGKGTFIIPSGLAYGPRQVGRSIPPNAVLKFEIELVDFE